MTGLTTEYESVTANLPDGAVIGKTSTSKIGFFGTAPVTRPTSAGDVTSFAAGVGTASKSDSVWAGSTGSTTYTVGDVVTILKKLGLLAL